MGFVAVQARRQKGQRLARGSLRCSSCPAPDPRAPNGTSWPLFRPRGQPCDQNECPSSVTRAFGFPPSFRSASMTANRLATATLLAVVALTCDITAVTAQTIVESDSSPRCGPGASRRAAGAGRTCSTAPTNSSSATSRARSRLENGSVVVADESNYEIRMFDAQRKARVDERTLTARGRASTRGSG